MKDIVIVGAGGLGRELLILLHQLNEISAQWNILGFYDDDTALSGSYINNFPCLGTVSDLESAQQELYVAVGVGSSQVRRQLIERLQHCSNLRFPVLVHPSAAIKPYQFIALAEGTIILQGAVLTTNITLGKHVFINLCCTVGHDASLGDFVSLMPGVNLSGGAVVEKAVYVGTNAAVLQDVRIGANTIVGAGAVVTKTLPAGCTAVGVPAKIIKQHEL